VIEQAVQRIFKAFGLRISRIMPAADPSLQQGLGDAERLARDYIHRQPLRLHFGCGPRVLKGWINIDLAYQTCDEQLQRHADKYYPPEMRGDKSDFYALDITKVGLPLPDNSVDVIFHEDFLEHLNQRDQIIFLAETLRILKTGAVHRVNTPNLLCSMEMHSRFRKGKRGVYVDEWNKWIHLNVMTPSMLEEMATMVGYSRVVFGGRDRSTSVLMPLEYRPFTDRPEDHGNIFADLIK
jgi:predicted SAM-dependent methyltransferase